VGSEFIHIFPGKDFEKGKHLKVDKEITEERETRPPELNKGRCT